MINSGSILPYFSGDDGVGDNYFLLLLTILTSLCFFFHYFILRIFINIY